MFDYAKYFLNPLVMLASIWGLLAGGNYTWLGFGILLGVGAITTGIFALRRHPKKSGGHLLSNARQLPWDAIVGLFTGVIGLALSGWFFVVVLPNM